MRPFFKSLLLFVAGTLALPAASEPREETVFVLENRKLSLVLPAGFDSATGKDDNGMTVIRVADARERFSLEISFMSDAEGRFASARARRELMYEMFAPYVDSSTEKGMQFEELEPRMGAGTYCVFTDAKLKDRPELPPGEYLHLTAGLKAWPGVAVVFRFFSNDVTSADYGAIVKMLRESVQEKPVPLR